MKSSLVDANRMHGWMVFISRNFQLTLGGRTILSGTRPLLRDLLLRRRQDYLQVYADYGWTIEVAMRQKKDTEAWGDATVDLNTVSFDYPVSISLVPVIES